MDHFQIPFIPKTIHFNNLMSTVKKKKIRSVWYFDSKEQK